MVDKLKRKREGGNP